MKVHVKNRSLRRYERVASLFEEHVTLMPLSYWLPEYAKSNKGRYTQVINLINDLLPLNCQIQKTVQENENLFEMNGIVLPFRALSDGFRAYIGWIGDMLFHVCQGVATGLKLREMRGVVMVDEIDLHLHPEWQKVVVPTLAKALPNVQFIFTTHSPIGGGFIDVTKPLFAESGGRFDAHKAAARTCEGQEFRTDSAFALFRPGQYSRRVYVNQTQRTGTQCRFRESRRQRQLPETYGNRPRVRPAAVTTDHFCA